MSITELDDVSIFQSDAIDSFVVYIDSIERSDVSYSINYYGRVKCYSKPREQATILTCTYWYRA